MQKFVFILPTLLLGCGGGIDSWVEATCDNAYECVADEARSDAMGEDREDCSTTAKAYIDDYLESNPECSWNKGPANDCIDAMEAGCDEDMSACELEDSLLTCD
jgi:hypothetical protein